MISEHKTLTKCNGHSNHEYVTSFWSLLNFINRGRVKSLRGNPKPKPCRIDQETNTTRLRFEIFPERRTEHLRLISCLYGGYYTVARRYEFNLCSSGMDNIVLATRT